MYTGMTTFLSRLHLQLLNMPPNPPNEDATPTPAVGLIKTISRTKEGSPLYHTTSSATDMVPEGHSCQGLAPPLQAQMDISASHHW